MQSTAEQCENGEDAAVVVFGVREAKLLEDTLHVALHRARAEVNLLRDRAVRPSFGDQREDRALTIRELVEGGAPVAADEALHDLGIESGATCRHALDRVDEFRNVSHPVLIASMAEIAGARWSPAYERAWTNAFGVVAGAMLEGARAASVEAAA
jgi:hypothetical protein